jgi:hypothetical protein
MVGQTERSPTLLSAHAGIENRLVFLIVGMGFDHLLGRLSRDSRSNSFFRL